jgi:hypothetical protein
VRAGLPQPELRPHAVGGHGHPPEVADIEGRGHDLPAGGAHPSQGVADVLGGEVDQPARRRSGVRRIRRKGQDTGDLAVA